MNRDEIAAKIADLENKIRMDKQSNSASQTKKKNKNSSGGDSDRYALCLGGGGGKGAYQLGVYRRFLSMDSWRELMPYQEHR